MEKIWKKIPNYENYEISNYGEIRSLNYYGRNEIRELKQSLAGKQRSYYSVGLYKNGKQKTFYVHTLMAKIFLNHISDDCEKVIDHIDGNTFSNRIDNLQIITQRENIHKGDMMKKKKNGLPPGVTRGNSPRGNKIDYKVSIYYNKKNYYLGRYPTPEQAYKVYLKKFNELNGQES